MIKENESIEIPNNQEIRVLFMKLLGKKVNFSIKKNDKDFMFIFNREIENKTEIMICKYQYEINYGFTHCFNPENLVTDNSVKDIIKWINKEDYFTKQTIEKIYK